MKSTAIVTLALASTILISGCLSRPRNLVLDPIGPPSTGRVGSGSDGTLVVFSAFDSSPRFGPRPYHRRHTDYQILSPSGQLLRAVHNDTDTMLEGPTEVELPAGEYRVLARANGYGLVTVPVSICAHQTTTVHLEGCATWTNKSVLANSKPVRLPDGQIAGWRADTSSTSANRK